MDTTEQAKSRGEYRLAGQLDRLAGNAAYYGCHYGMRSDRANAVAEYHAGWSEIHGALSGNAAPRD